MECNFCDAQNPGGPFFFFFFHHCPSLLRQTILCRDRIPLLRAYLCHVRLRLVVRAWPGLSREHGLQCRDTTRRHTVMRPSLRTPNPVVCGRTLCLGQLYSDIISPCLGHLCRDIKILSRDRKSSQPCQLCL